MGHALSCDLRDRTLAAVDAGVSRRAAAERFGVSAASVIRWDQLRRLQGHARPKPQGGDKSSHRIEAHAEVIFEAVKRQPDITLEELRVRLAERGVAVAVSARSGGSSTRHGVTLKKRPAHAAEQDRPDVLKRRGGLVRRSARARSRSAWSSSTRPGCRPRWRARHGRCAERRAARDRACPHGHWKTTTFVAGLRMSGMAAPMVLDGPMNGDAFLAYVEQILVPELRPGDIVMMDNLSQPQGPGRPRR